MPSVHGDQIPRQGDLDATANVNWHLWHVDRCEHKPCGIPGCQLYYAGWDRAFSRVLDVCVEALPAGNGGNGAHPGS